MWHSWLWHLSGKTALTQSEMSFNQHSLARPLACQSKEFVKIALALAVLWLAIIAGSTGKAAHPFLL